MDGDVHCWVGFRGGSCAERALVFSTILFVLGFFLATTNVVAQSDRGAIAGTVLDSSGGVVANATVTATQTETGAVNTATTGPTGGFRLYDLRLGTYKVTATAPGFKTDEKTGVVVQVGIDCIPGIRTAAGGRQRNGHDRGGCAGSADRIFRYGHSCGQKANSGPPVVP